MKILFNSFIHNFCHKEIILVNVSVRNFKHRELTNE